MNSNPSQATQQSVPPKPSGKKSNLALIIILIAVGVLIMLGIGGYFGWKYFKTKISSKADTTTTTTKNSDFTLSQLEEMIKYPNGTLKSTDRSKASGFTSVLEMETTDSIVTANNYYLSLNSNNKWTVSAKSLETDNSRADITYTGASDQFTVTIIIDHVYDNTTILVRIDATNMPVGTPLGTTTTTKPTTTTTTTNPSTDTTKKTISTDYVIADSNTRIIAEDELASLTPWQLKVARNEIYARYGRAFIHKDLQCYFKTQNWYKIDTNFTESELSSIDTKNIATIQAYEQKTNSPLQNTDSGGC